MSLKPPPENTPLSRSAPGLRKRDRFSLPLIMICLLFVALPAWGGDDQARTLYESRRAQLDFLLINVMVPDSLIIYYLDEARYFAGLGDFNLATDLLDQAMQLTNTTWQLAGTASADTTQWQVWPEPLCGSLWQVIAEVGADYSRNEYELSFLESDSVILEELYHPYFALRIARSASSGNRNSSFLNYTHLEESLFQSGLYLALESVSYQKRWRIEGNSDFFSAGKDAGANSWSNELRFYWSQYLTIKNQFLFNSRGRYKLYFPAGDTYQNSLGGDIQMALRHYFQTLCWLELAILPSLYRENSGEGFIYRQIQSRLDYQYRSDYNRFLNVSLNHYLRNFENSSVSLDYRNQHQAFRPAVEGEWTLWKPFGLKGQLEWEDRRYLHPDLTYSDFTYGSASTQLRFYFGEYNTAGIGLVFDFERHTAGTPDEQPLTEQENFNSRGFIVSVDLLNVRGLLISFSYQYTRRDYPLSIAPDYFNIYSDRQVQTIQGIGYIPFHSQWQFQFFVNFDEDRDRQHDNNDNLTSLLNISLQYKF